MQSSSPYNVGWDNFLNFAASLALRYSVSLWGFLVVKGFEVPDSIGLSKEREGLWREGLARTRQ